MLYANKQDVEADLRVQLLAIRERELRFYTANCRTIGTQASVFAGFAYVLTFSYGVRFEGREVVAQLDDAPSQPPAAPSQPYAPPSPPPPPGFLAEASATPEALRVLFVLCATAAMTLNLGAMFFANCLALFGPGLALRGDGIEAMDRAVDGLALEYRLVFLAFFLGTLSFWAIAFIYSLMQGDLILSVSLICVLVYLLRHTLRAFTRLYKRFRLPPALAHSGNFNAQDGSRMVDPLVHEAQVAALSRHAQWLEKLAQRKRCLDWPLRQYLYLRLFFDDFVGVSAEVFELRYRGHATAPRGAGDAMTSKVLQAIELNRCSESTAVDYSPHVQRALSQASLSRASAFCGVVHSLTHPSAYLSSVPC